MAATPEVVAPDVSNRAALLSAGTSSKMASTPQAPTGQAGTPVAGMACEGRDPMLSQFVVPLILLWLAVRPALRPRAPLAGRPPCRQRRPVASPHCSYCTAPHPAVRFGPCVIPSKQEPCPVSAARCWVRACTCVARRKATPCRRPNHGATEIPRLSWLIP